MTEQAIKRERIQQFLAEQGLDGLLLLRQSNFSWATCGGSNYVALASEQGVAALLFTPDRAYVLASTIEAPRISTEEVAGQGFELVVFPWWVGGALEEAVGRVLPPGARLGADAPWPGAQPVEGALSVLRARLTPEEQVRFRALGADAGAAMAAAIRQVQPGLREDAIAGYLAAQTWQRGAQPVVLLVATDARVFQYRHPIPTQKILERYAMLVLCARRGGLVASVTRLVHFGRLSDELQAKQMALALVDAAFITATRPGVTLGAVFAAGQRAYARVGYPDEWQLHHQGGPAGYESREAVATPDHPRRVEAGQVFAWNPSIAGTKSEDSVLIGAGPPEVLTAIPGWPTLDVESDGVALARPAILEIT